MLQIKSLFLSPQHNITLKGFQGLSKMGVIGKNGFWITNKIFSEKNALNQHMRHPLIIIL